MFYMVVAIAKFFAHAMIYMVVAIAKFFAHAMICMVVAIAKFFGYAMICIVNFPLAIGNGLLSYISIFFKPKR